MSIIQCHVNLTIKNFMKGPVRGVTGQPKSVSPMSFLLGVGGSRKRNRELSIFPTPKLTTKLRWVCYSHFVDKETES